MSETTSKSDPDYNPATDPALVEQAKAFRLTKVQDRSVRMIDENGEYTCLASGNYYHPLHRPGNYYVDYRTADVLIRHGLAERRFGRLFCTDLGYAYIRNVKRLDPTDC